MSRKIVPVRSPSGDPFRIRLSAVEGIESVGRSLIERRFYVRYKTGRRVEVDYQSALDVFDLLSPELF